MTPERRRSRKVDNFLAVCATLGLVSAIVTGVYISPALLDTSDRTGDVEKLTAENAQRIHDIAVLTSANAKLTRQIQDERTRNVLVNCRETNHRHDATISKLNELVAATSGADRARAQANRAGTVALLEAIVPHRNCRALVRRQVPSNTP